MRSVSLFNRIIYANTCEGALTEVNRGRRNRWPSSVRLLLLFLLPPERLEIRRWIMELRLVLGTGKEPLGAQNDAAGILYVVLKGFFIANDTGLYSACE